MAICETFCSKISSNQANIVKKIIFTKKLKIFQKRTLFDEILLPAFIWIISSLQIFELSLPDPRILHITFLTHWMYLLMLFLLLFQKNDGNIRTICSSLRLFYFFLHVCLLLFSNFDFTELVYEATKFGHEAEKSLMVSRWFKF